jgi:hypothetical protein
VAPPFELPPLPYPEDALAPYLAKAEAGDEWEKAEKKWEQLKAKTRVLGTEAGDASKDIGAAAKQLVKEIRHGYDRIRNLL